ncbi:MAG: hypothetical protein WBN71_04395 [Acidimicrobiia bacterium]|jgi:hypothetical protein
MTQKPEEQAAGAGEDLDELEAKLKAADAADAPETAEHVAQLLGTALDDIEGGRGSGPP